MKAALIFACLISFALTQYISDCNPGYNNGVDDPKQCKNVGVQYNTNECCMLSYYDTAKNFYKCCYEFDAHMFVRFDEYKTEMKKSIQSYYPYPKFAPVDTIENFTCASNYLKMSLLALLFALF